LHFIFLLMVCLFALTGCVYYGDIHDHSKPLNPASLTAPHVYPIPEKKVEEKGCWWNKFKDPQLNQLIEIALADSPTMQIAAARMRESRYVVDAMTASLWPSIEMNGYIQKQKFSATGLAPPPFNGKTFNIADLALNFNYEFDFWGKNRESVRAAVSEAFAAEADLQEARLVLAAAVANTYFQLLGIHEQWKILKDNLQQTTELSDIVTDRAKNGVESDIPVKTALANIQNAKLQVLQYAEAEKVTRHQLAALLGKNPFQTDIKIVFSYHKNNVKLPPCLMANILAERPDIDAAKARVVARAHRINVAKARFFPNINLIGLFSYQSVQLNHLFNSDNQNNAITGAIDLPIFDAGLRRANLKEDYAKYDVAVNEYNNTILTALREVADQNTILRSLEKQLAAQTAAVNATRHNYQLFNARYRHGIVDYVQVLEIKELLLEEEAQLVSLETQHLQATVTLLKALGGPES